MKNNMIMLFFASSIIILGTVLFILFRPIEGEEGYFKKLVGWEGQINRFTSKEEFKRLVAADEETKEQVESEINSAGGKVFTPSQPLSIASWASDKQVELNTHIYAIAEDAFNTYGGTIPAEIKDPLVALAQANTETSGWPDWKNVWASAIPAKLMEGSEITVEGINSFNVAKAVKLFSSKGSNEWLSNKAHQGILQFKVLYGISNNPNYTDGKINFTSEADTIASDSQALSLVRGSQYIDKSLIRDEDCCKASGDYSTHYGKKFGDRYNWNDAVMTAVQKWEYDFSRIKDNRSDKLQNPYNFVAYMAMNHNIGESVSVSALTKSRGNMCTGCTYKDIWDFIAYMGHPNTVAELEKIANVKVTNIKNGSGPGNMTTAEIGQVLNATSSSYPKGPSLKYTSYEGIIHAFRVSLNYTILRQLYFEGGASA